MFLKFFSLVFVGGISCIMVCVFFEGDVFGVLGFFVVFEVFFLFSICVVFFGFGRCVVVISFRIIMCKVVLVFGVVCVL